MSGVEGTRGEKTPYQVCPAPGLITGKTLDVQDPLPSETRTLLGLRELARKSPENVFETAAQSLCALAWQSEQVMLRERRNNELRLPWTRGEEAAASSLPDRCAGRTGWHCRARRGVLPGNLQLRSKA